MPKNELDTKEMLRTLLPVGCRPCHKVDFNIKPTGVIFKYPPDCAVCEVKRE